MASSSQPDFDEFEQAPEQTNNDGWIDLDAGDVVTGRITGFRPEASYNGVVEIDGRPMRLNRTLKNQIIAALVEGEEIAIKCLEEERSFTNDDGEEQTYHPKQARFRSGD